MLLHFIPLHLRVCKHRALLGTRSAQRSSEISPGIVMATGSTEPGKGAWGCWMLGTAGHKGNWAHSSMTSSATDPHKSIKPVAMPTACSSPVHHSAVAVPASSHPACHEVMPWGLVTTTVSPFVLPSVAPSRIGILNSSVSKADIPVASTPEGNLGTGCWEECGLKDCSCPKMHPSYPPLSLWRQVLSPPSVT